MRRMKTVLAGLMLAVICAPAIARAQEVEPVRHGFWQRAHPLVVERGVLTVNGMTVKTGLNFRVADLHCLFVDVPGAGTVVISDRPFTGAREQKGAFRGGVLTVWAGESRVQLSAARKVHGNGPAYVRLDGGSRSGSRVPEIGYGGAAMSRVTWVQDAGGVMARRRRLNVSVGRRLREAKLCRPSRRGPEKCAVVREMPVRD